MDLLLKEIDSKAKVAKRVEIIAEGLDYPKDIGTAIRNHIKLNCGAVLSVQASPCHYCTPRVFYQNISQYRSVEIMIVSGGEKLNYDIFFEAELIEEGRWDWSSEPIGYVSIDELVSFIQSNGGLYEK